MYLCLHGCIYNLFLFSFFWVSRGLSSWRAHQRMLQAGLPVDVRSHTGHDSSICVHDSLLVHMCDMTHPYVWLDLFIHVHSHTWHASSICVTWLIHRCTFAHVTWLIHMCDMTRSHVWHDSFICVTWHIRMCDMTHSYVWYDSFICVTWHIHMCDMTHS